MVVAAESVYQVGAAALPRRPGVLIATMNPPGADIWAAAVAIGVEQVLELPAGQTCLVDRITDAAGGSGPLGILIAVIGGCGGAGASTLAAALAVSAARTGAQPVLLGADHGTAASTLRSELRMCQALAGPISPGSPADCRLRPFSTGCRRHMGCAS